jgi:[acyl-carrier-protein] S-malonyltransferase
MKADGVDRIVELGAGKALTGMVKRIDAEISGSAVGTPADIETLLKTL